MWEVPLLSSSHKVISQPDIMFTNCMIQVTPTGLAMTVFLTLKIFYILNGLALLILMVLLYELVNRSLYQNGGKQLCQLEQMSKDEEIPNKVNSAKKIIQPREKLDEKTKAEKKARAKAEAKAKEKAKAEKRARAKEEAKVKEKVKAEKAQAKADKKIRAKEEAKAKETAKAEKAQARRRQRPENRSTPESNFSV